MLTVGLDSTVLTVALPTLAKDLHASTSQLQWFSGAYTLVLAAVLAVIVLPRTHPVGSPGEKGADLEDAVQEGSINVR